MTSLCALLVEARGSSVALSGALRADGAIELVPVRGFGNLIEKVRSVNPDIVVMVPATQSQAVAAVQELMAVSPVPILVLSDPSWPGSSVVKAGAVDSMPVPVDDPMTYAELRSRVRLVSRVKTIRHIRGRSRSDIEPARVPIVAIAASTGGPAAVISVLQGLLGLKASVTIVQHLHPAFTSHFLEWMARESPLHVQMAIDGLQLEPGHVYLAPAQMHMKLGGGRRLELSDVPASLHMPSADVLFSSIARRAGPESIGVLLTGMGDDGASGLLEMRHAGAYTIAQDKDSSVIYGMPAAAQEIGAAEHILPLAQIPHAILRGVAQLV